MAAHTSIWKASHSRPDQTPPIYSSDATSERRTRVRRSERTLWRKRETSRTFRADGIRLSSLSLSRSCKIKARFVWFWKDHSPQNSTQDSRLTGFHSNQTQHSQVKNLLLRFRNTLHVWILDIKRVYCGQHPRVMGDFVWEGEGCE